VAVLLQVQNLSHFFGPKLVFKNVSFAVAPGEVVLVTGPNGSGKTTLLKILAGLLQPTSGRISHELARDQIGYMGHQSFVYPLLTARENLLFWVRLCCRTPKEVDIDELGRRVGLGHVMDERAGNFSRGMEQRLSLARLLCLDPWLCLLDEPATGLDRASREILHGEIGQARDRGRTVLWISHDQDRDSGKADRVLSLDRGRAELSASTADALTG
jgi:heme exporter protein A